MARNHPPKNPDVTEVSRVVLGSLSDHTRKAVELLVIKRNTVQNAITNARSGIAKSTDKTPDSHEQAGDYQRDAELAVLNEHTAKRLDGIGTEMAEAEPAPFYSDNMAAEVMATIDNEKGKRFDPLRQRFSECAAAARELRIALMQHPGSVIYGCTVWVVVLHLLAVGITETIANGTFIAPYLAGDLSEGIGYSICLSFVSMAAGFGSTFWGLRYARFKPGVWRAVGLAVMAACIAVGLGANLVFALYRNSLEQTAAQTAFGDTTGSVVSLMGVSMTTGSLLLLMVGIACFCFAAVKGYGGPLSACDPRPGIATLDRKATDTQKKLTALKDELRTAVQVELKAFCQTHIWARAHEDKEKVLRLKKLAGDAEAVAAEGLNQAKETIRMYGLERRYYRELLCYMRGPEWHPPAYFAVYPTPQEVLDRFPTAEPHRLRLAEAEGLRDRNLEAMRAAEREIFQLMSLELRRFFENMEEMKQHSRRESVQIVKDLEDVS